jgi:hypothetical protein
VESKLFGVSAAPPTTTEPPTDSLNHLVHLGPDWYKKIDLAMFDTWRNAQGIKDEEWDFRLIGIMDERPKIAFSRAEDAVAFSLRFGL